MTTPSNRDRARERAQDTIRFDTNPVLDELYGETAACVAAREFLAMEAELSGLRHEFKMLQAGALREHEELTAERDRSERLLSMVSEARQGLEGQCRVAQHQPGEYKSYCGGCELLARWDGGK